MCAFGQAAIVKVCGNAYRCAFSARPGIAKHAGKLLHIRLQLAADRVQW
jgi:hypothetical protein